MTKTTTHTLPAGAFWAERGEVEPPEQFTRRDPGSDHDTIELRLSRLEAWMRNEIFARTAMDEPDPESVTAGHVNPDEIIRSILDDQYEHPVNQYQTGYNQALVKAARIIRAHINDRRAPVAKGGAGE